MISPLNIYHALPYPLRVAAASLRGYHLRSWRYGPDEERLIKAALERDSWDAQSRRAWEIDRLTYILERSATKVPFYKEQWARRRRVGDKASWSYLEHWPLLTKEQLRSSPRAFVADDRMSSKMYAEHTSGTTGKPLDLWWSRETTRAWYALFETRVRRWNNVSRQDNWAILGGQPIVSAAAKKPPFWVWNAPMRQLYLSANHVSPNNAAAYLDAISHYQITHLLVYPSSACILAQAALERKERLQHLRAIMTNAEPLFSWQREILSKGFGCPVRETYGMAELVCAATECQAGKLHLWPEVGWMEVLHDTSSDSVATGQDGRFICTSLLNEDMPLIRYQVGDRGRIDSSNTSCDCGRQLLQISGIEGRVNDMLTGPDGKRIFWINPIFYGLPIQEAQVVQDSLEKLRVLCVGAHGYSSKTSRTISDRLAARMGSIEISVVVVASIPRGPNGKFRAIINNIPSMALDRALGPT